MSEFRQNPITKQWVLISPIRAKKPEEFTVPSVSKGLPEHDEKCVFCHGNEDLNPDLCEDVCRLPKSSEWKVRVIANKYPALQKSKVFTASEFYNSRPGNGSHEVIITSKHNEPPALQSIDTIKLTLNTVIERIKANGAEDEVQYVQFFHNHGSDAGASIIHPHYQIMATPFVPPHVHDELRGCLDYFRLNKKCVYCEIIEQESELKERIVYENEHFTVLSAYASRQPFETWILPKRHMAKFEEMTVKEIQNLSYVLKDALNKLYERLGDPPLNFYLHNMPFLKQSHLLSEQKSFHWHLTIFPRITKWAGFEFSTNIAVNPMPPEETARFLRGD